MKNLDWIQLESKFYDFLAVASRLGFYVPELRQMERSLWECQPAEMKGEMTNEGVFESGA